MWDHLKNLSNRLKPDLNPELSRTSLRLFRFLLGALIAYDLVAHLSDILIFFTDHGVLPRETAYQSVISGIQSFYFWSGSLPFILGIYLIHILLALCFMAGRGLPWVTIILWMLQFSLRDRNMAIADGGDDLAIILLFFSIFLPLQERGRKLTHSFWHLVFITQFLCIYYFSSLLKSDATWTTNFTAIMLVFRLDVLANAFAKSLLAYPSLLKIMTATTIWLECCGPIIYFIAMLFSGKASLRTRQAICLCFIFFHLALSATLRLGVFPYLCIAGWVALFPRDEERPQGLTREPTEAPTVVLSLVTLATILCLNFQTIDPTFRTPTAIQWFANTFSLQQRWGMFAPYPVLNNQHIRTFGEFADGSVHELEVETNWYENRHRIKYWLNMGLRRTDFLREYALYECRKHNELKPLAPLMVRAKVVAINRIASKDNPDLNDRQLPSAQLIRTQLCYEP